MQGLEDVEVVDAEPVVAGLISRAGAAGGVVFYDGGAQTFDVNGGTRGGGADGRLTQGTWYGGEEGRFCSFWPPPYRVCYGLLGMVEGDEIVGLSFTGRGGGARFDGRYATRAHRARR